MRRHFVSFADVKWHVIAVQTCVLSTSGSASNAEDKMVEMHTNNGCLQKLISIIPFRLLTYDLLYRLVLNVARRLSDP